MTASSTGASVRRLMGLDGAVEAIGPGNVFPTVRAAVAALES